MSKINSGIGHKRKYTDAQIFVNATQFAWELNRRIENLPRGSQSRYADQIARNAMEAAVEFSKSYNTKDLKEKIEHSSKAFDTYKDVEIRINYMLQSSLISPKSGMYLITVLGDLLDQCEKWRDSLIKKTKEPTELIEEDMLRILET